MKAVSERTLLSHWKTAKDGTLLAGKGCFHWHVTALPAPPTLSIKRHIWVWGTRWRRGTDSSGDPPPPLLVTLCLALDRHPHLFAFTHFAVIKQSAVINFFLPITPVSASVCACPADPWVVCRACSGKLCLLSSKSSEQRSRNFHGRYQRQRTCQLRNVQFPPEIGI